MAERTFFLEKYCNNNQSYVDFLNAGRTDFVAKVFKAADMDYAVSHFLDFSGKVGFDIVETNAMLNTEGTHKIAIALVEGDDIICMDTDDGSIFLWLVQTGNGEYIRVASSFKEFLQISKQ